MHVLSSFPFVSARELAKCTGKIVSMMLVIVVLRFLVVCSGKKSGSVI